MTGSLDGIMWTVRGNAAYFSTQTIAGGIKGSFPFPL